MFPSSSNPPSVNLTSADLVSLYQYLWIPQTQYLAVGSSALIIYEHLLTVHEESRVIWRSRYTVPTVLFFINRFALLAVAGLYLVSSFNWWGEDLVCATITRALSSLTVILDMVNIVFSALRIHAINNRNWWLTALVFILGFVSVPANIAQLSTASIGTGNPLAVGCYSTQGIEQDPQLWYRVALAVRICVIAQIVLVLGITWYRTAGVVLLARSANVDTSLISVLLRDGTMYFLVNLAINIAGIATLVVGLNSLNIQANM
ncbi:hypothetical protein C8Q76DRAFT_755343 [Earliella scabrosa]|nr:hypothetical protein C8Q76DRAFT_755343 [Earliella scabrosa]